MEFLAVNSKNTMETLKENLDRIYNEKKEIGKKYETLKIEFDKNSEIRLQDRLRMDSVITFCGLMESCNLPTEIASRMGDLPTIISSYLKGASKSISISPKKPEFDQRKININNVSANKLLGTKEGNENEKNIKLVVNELTDIKGSVDVLKSAISRMMQNSDITAKAIEEGSTNPHVISKSLSVSKNYGKCDFEKQTESKNQREFERQSEIEKQKELNRQKEIDFQKEIDKYNDKERLRSEHEELIKKKKSTISTGKGRLCKENLLV